MRQFQSGDLVQHFKRQWADVQSDPQVCLYEIVGVAIETETREELMIYKALYGEGGLYARPLALFMSVVDQDKYPHSCQVYRFEKVEGCHD